MAQTYTVQMTEDEFKRYAFCFCSIAEKNKKNSSYYTKSKASKQEYEAENLIAMLRGLTEEQKQEIRNSCAETQKKSEEKEFLEQFKLFAWPEELKHLSVEQKREVLHYYRGRSSDQVPRPLALQALTTSLSSLRIKGEKQSTVALTHLPGLGIGEYVASIQAEETKKTTPPPTPLPGSGAVSWGA